jgi:hypothetical protein
MIEYWRVPSDYKTWQLPIMPDVLPIAGRITEAYTDIRKCEVNRPFGEYVHHKCRHHDLYLFWVRGELD